ncbi:hypothetical protein PILCRDRAFT_814357 [Piloderma croceum F 1598]|uniref:DUF6534 domain-containing protein n=1 Tax=Piloderma croceum (strain F 1598) TaxID=765440 RepID=A0A0C3CFD3_PILCF|nr:hypothetical protein PILCRDRAFT_814357 [Piloderma croceum F 1598]
MIQMIFATHTAWECVISGWGNPAILFQPAWSLTAMTFISSLISAMVQVFFAWRIWMLQKSSLARCIAVLIVLVAFTQAICTIVSSFRLVFNGNHVSRQLSSISSGFITGFAGNFVADTLIAGCQLVILSRARSNSPFKKTETVVTKLIVHTVQTAAVTAVASLAGLILYTTLPNTFVSIVTAYMIAKLYSNVLLANLNARSSQSGGTSLEMGPHPASLVVHISTESTAGIHETSGDWNKSQIEGARMFP